MGTLFRLLVFILALGALGTGTAWLLARERQRESARDHMPAAALDQPDPSRAALLRHYQSAAERDLVLFGALSIACLLVVAIVPARIASDPAPAPGPRSHDSVQREMIGLEHLARTTVAQRAELDQERESRHRSEQDLYLQQALTNHALQDKIRLGRDLHDGLVQTLYATGLLVESATHLIPSDPAHAARVLAGAKSNLQTAIRDTRSVIDGLSPAELENRSLADSIGSLLDLLDGGRLEQRDITLDPALPTLDRKLTNELLQIIRESASNALRHGHATVLAIRCAPEGGTLRLTIRDNGAGFDPATARRGHGLDNLSARARLVGGHLDISSHPGEGACVNLTLPLPSA
jgi:signal transduction histidine kinase